jgi:cysteine desulfurase/selenocysteine lyase
MEPAVTPAREPTLADIREHFPALARRSGGKQVVFADNASTSLKPRVVIDAVQHYYTDVCANVHRGVSLLAQEADALFEDARVAVADLINASADEIVFVRNTTEAINLAAHLVGLGQDDEIVCSVADHHSNLLPWRARAAVRTATVNESGELPVDDMLGAIGPRTRLLALGHASNVTGVIAPIEAMIAEARRRGLLTLVDAAQSVAHMPIDVKALGCDFLAFSAHKMCGPSGIGVLYGRRELLEAGSPMLFGGGMVTRVTSQAVELERIPHRYEAGTPNIEGAIGLGAAARFLMAVGMDDVQEHGRRLAQALVEQVGGIPGLELRPALSSATRLPIVSFTARGMSADDLAGMLSNRYAIMVRSGMHCAEPLVRHFGDRAQVRVSLALYNTLDEVAYIGEALRAVCRLFPGGRP